MLHSNSISSAHTSSAQPTASFWGWWREARHPASYSKPKSCSKPGTGGTTAMVLGLGGATWKGCVQGARGGPGRYALPWQVQLLHKFLEKRLGFYILAACSQNINIAVVYAEALVDMTGAQGCWVTTCKVPWECEVLETNYLLCLPLIVKGPARKCRRKQRSKIHCKVTLEAYTTSSTRCHVPQTADLHLQLFQFCLPVKWIWQKTNFVWKCVIQKEKEISIQESHEGFREQRCIGSLTGKGSRERKASCRSCSWWKEAILAWTDWAKGCWKEAK